MWAGGAAKGRGGVQEACVSFADISCGWEGWQRACVVKFDE